VALRARGLSLIDVVALLAKRHNVGRGN